jgi:hypothetical protein
VRLTWHALARGGYYELARMLLTQSLATLEGTSAYVARTEYASLLGSDGQWLEGSRTCRDGVARVREVNVPQERKPRRTGGSLFRTVIVR